MAEQTEPVVQEREWIHGPTVDKQTRELRFLSVSSIERGDPTTETGCARKWWYDRVMGIKEPPSRSLDDGKRLHAEIENYLTAPDPAVVRATLSSQILAGLHMIPEPGPDLLVEHDIVPAMPDGSSGLHLTPLRAAGIPIVGAIDLIHKRGTNKGATDVMETVDPPGTIEIIDWKSCKSLDWIKTPNDLAKNTQLVGYANYVFTVEPEAQLVRLSHGYFPQRGTPRKVSVRIDRDQASRAWEAPSRVAGYLRDVAKETDPEKVDANTRACRAYGRDCPARSVCTAGMQNSLASLIGQTAASNISNQLQGIMTVPITPSSLLAKMQARTAPATAPAAAPAATATAAAPLLGALAAPATPPKPSPEELAAEVSRLAAEEINTKYPGLAAIVEQIHEAGLGFPALSGEAAVAVAGLNGAQISRGAGLAGFGELAQVTLSQVDQLAAVLGEIPAILASRAETPAPTEASESVPSILPPDAPNQATIAQFDPTVVEATPTPVEVLAASVETGKRGRGRPPKAKATAAPVQEAAPTEPESASFAAPANVSVGTPTNTTTDTTINLYVDCVPSRGAESLWPLVNRLTGIMTEQSGASDFRCADPKSNFSYGGWKGILTAMVRQTQIPPGDYMLDASFSEVAQVVAEAMRLVVETSGGNYVRGTR